MIHSASSFGTAAQHLAERLPNGLCRGAAQQGPRRFDPRGSSPLRSHPASPLIKARFRAEQEQGVTQDDARDDARRIGSGDGEGEQAVGVRNRAPSRCPQGSQTGT